MPASTVEFNVIQVPSALKADFWMLKPDEFHREMFHRKVRDMWLGETVWIASAEDIDSAAQALLEPYHPSERQLADVAGVVAVQGERLHRAFLRKWATDLG